jgi:glycosyltransferase involved in cell wall biosynthesis
MSRGRNREWGSPNQSQIWKPQFEMPRVSVLLTCFNHIRYLPAAYEAVLSQTFTDYEIIAIDDGSTDGTREWLSARPEPIKRIFNEKNLGTYASLNVALSKANGTYIAILNDDDLWAPDKLAKQVALLDANAEIGLVHTDGSFIDADGKPMEGSPLGFAFPRFETGDVLLGLVYENKIIASAALARKKCFEDLGGFNEAFFGSGDWEMWFRIAEKWKVGFIPEPLTFYRVHGANASHKLERIWKDDQMLREWIANELNNMDKDRFPDNDIRRAKAHNYSCLGTVKALNGDTIGGRAAYAKSIQLAPERMKSYLRYAATLLPAPVFRKLL